MASRTAGRVPRGLLWGVAVLIAAGFLLFVGAPQVVAWRLEQAIARQIPGGEAVAVEVAASPRALIGRLDRLEMDIRRARFGDLPVERATVHLSDVRVDAVRLLLDAQFVVAHVGAGEGRMALRQEDLQQYLGTVKGVRDAMVTLDDGLVTVEGDIRVLTFDLRAHIEGRLVVASPKVVNLQVQTLTVSGLELPAEVGNALVSVLNPLIVLDGFPVPVQVTGVVVDNGAAELALAVEKR